MTRISPPSVATDSFPLTNVLGVDIHRLRMHELLLKIRQAVEEGLRLRLGMVNAGKLVNMRTDGVLAEDVRSSDLVVADGMAVVWVSWFSSEPLPGRVAGIDIMMETLALANDQCYRIYFLGARPDVLQSVVNRVDQEFSNLVVAGYQDGYFSRDDESAIVETINASRPDILFVAIASPMKERFMSNWASMLAVQVIHGVGGSFDVYAGMVNRAPVWMQNIGLEWLYRVFQEPRRLLWRYFSTNMKFIFYVLRDLFGRRRIGKS